MANNKNRRRSSLTPGEFLMFLAGGMFCLILITTAMMGGLLARYTTENEGTDSARVAKFAVDVSDLKDVEIQYGVSQDDSGDYILTVENDSEVAVTYGAVVTVKKLDFDILVTLGGKELSTKDSTKLEFPNLGTVAPGPDAKDECALTFKVEDWKAFTQLEERTASIQKEVDFTITVKVEQID